MSLSPTQLSLRKLRADGYLAVVLEKWNQWAKIRQDVFGFDLIGVGNDEIVLVQATSDSNVSARVRKLADMESTGRLRKAGAILFVWGWKKVGNRWQVREVDIS